jgi:TolB protein
MSARTISVLAVLLLALVAGPAADARDGARSAQAAFPGTNGTIAFASDRDGDYEVFTMEAGGGSQLPLTSNSALDTSPA